MYIAYEEQGDPMRIADEQDKARQKKKQHMTTWSIDYLFMIDNDDLCTREEMERVGWDKIRDTVLVSEDLATGGSLGKRKRRPVDRVKDQRRHRRIWIRRCACSYQVGSRTSDC